MFLRGDCTLKPRRPSGLAILLGLAGSLALHSSDAAEPAWKPAKPIELVATNAPGGGADRILRMMGKIIQGRHDFPVPISAAFASSLLRNGQVPILEGFWRSEFMGSRETRKLLERENVEARAFLVDPGLAK